MLKVELLQSSFEQIKPWAKDFSDRFYENLFTMYPSAQPLFEHTNMAKQKKMLLDSLVFTVDNLTNPDALAEKLQGLGARHVRYGALPEHYPLVGNALLATFEQYLGNDWTEETKQAWVEAYGAITDLMLSGADYTGEEVALDTVASASTGVTVAANNEALEASVPSTTSESISDEEIIASSAVEDYPEPVSTNEEITTSTRMTTPSESVSEEEDSIWEIVAGIFLAFGGVGAVLIFLLL